MRYKLLGKSGLRVSELCLGTMTFGETWGWGASKEESKKQFDYFAEQGGNFIDTSVNYTDGTSEEFLGDFISQADREYFVVATKYTLTKPDSTDPNSGGNSRKNMMKSVERSLRRLQTEYLDILYLHMWDYMTPVEEVMRGLDDLVTAGKINYVAISDTPAYIVAEANMMAELRGWSRFIGLQVPYSLLRRDIERELIPMAHHWDMAVLPWGLLRAGVLTGKFLQPSDEPTRINRDELNLSERALNIVKEVVKVAEETGHSPAQVAINWVRQQPKAQMIPILGARTVEHLKDNMEAVDWQLSDEHWQRLDEVSAIDLGFPHGFLDANQYIFGATHDKIDNHRR
ncbi:MAG: aldo/keto reductase [Chloroflexi bacterium]|nr:MAG: aldo/keto reductase [Chloroflexota bacterium]